MGFIVRFMAVLVVLVTPGMVASAAGPERGPDDSTGGAAPDPPPRSDGEGEPVPTWESEAPEGEGGAAADAAEPPPAPPPRPAERVDLGCQASPWCHIQGRCSAVAGQCLSRSDAECRASLWCRDFGLCRAGQDGTCGAHTDADCEQSTACRNRGLCEARQRRCGTMRPIALPEDDDEPEGPYVPKKGRNTSRNVPVLVSGIVLTTAGGAGLVWMISELFTAWGTTARGTGASGGNVNDEQETRIIGSIALTVGGLGIGLPVLIYGARSRPTRSTSQAAPVLVVAPGAATLHWTF